MKSDGDVTEGSEEIAEKAGEKRKQDEEAHARYRDAIVIIS